MSGHCPQCGTYCEEDDDRVCSECASFSDTGNVEADATPAPPRRGTPAFPEQNIMAHGDMIKVTTTSGMTLRQWFAGQALVAFAVRGSTSFQEDAEDAFALADEMMKLSGNSSETPNGSEEGA